jgi:Raf kinase inhibitor-like YbhB/YbcL family protein
MKNNEINKLLISSPAFENEGDIPPKYTCDGEDINPQLTVDNIPGNTKTLAIIVEDPDAPKETFDHWLVWNVPPESIIEENRVPGISGTNGAGKTGYYGPCPPSGTHRYYFHVFALDSSLDLQGGTDKKTLQNTMEPHIVAKGTLMGRYKKAAKKKV